MRYLHNYLFALLVTLGFLTSCYDDSDLQDKVNSLDDRLTAVEKLTAQINTNISALQTAVTALQNNDYVTGFAEIKEGDKLIGYSLIFAKSGVATIYLGDGAVAPSISVKLFDDGMYYWTINGSWLTDSAGNKVRANGKDGANGTDGKDGVNGTDGTDGADGKDGVNGTDGTNGADGKDGADGVNGTDGKNGITPQLKIEDNNWLLSLDNGLTWSIVGKATSESGDPIFNSVTQDSSSVTLTLMDGSVIKLPKAKMLSISFDEDTDISITGGETKTLKYTVMGATENTIVKAVAQNGWKAVVNATNNSSGTLVVTAPSVLVEDEILVFVYDGELKTIMTSINFITGVVFTSAQSYSVQSNASSLAVNIDTNVDYVIDIPQGAQSWISLGSIATRSVMRRETISFNLSANNTGFSRYSTVSIKNNGGVVLQTIAIEQLSSTSNINRVSQFVYDGMSTYYLWSNEVVNKRPTEADTNPVTYFNSILNSIDTQHGWSWITDDVDGLLDGFSGALAGNYGFSPIALWADELRTRIYGVIRYVFPGSPAEIAGLKRGDIITHANGTLLNGNNYTILYESDAQVVFTVMDQNFSATKSVTITPGNLKYDPVLFKKVYEIAGQKFGYLFYTGFVNDYNESLHRAFAEFKSAGISNLVLDLRYNLGGGVMASTYLASLIAPESAVRNKGVFTILNYNDYINQLYLANSYDRNEYLGSYDSKFSNPLTANLNLNKVYIIATSSSYSASELLTHCLAPYMDVVHIGEKTGGKYTASWTIHAYDNYGGLAQNVYKESSLTADEKLKLRNWAMQPIVAKYTDKNNVDFIATDGLIPDQPVPTQEYAPSLWKPIGDVNDYLLAKAISLITGTPVSTGIKTRSAYSPVFQNANKYSDIENIIRNGVIIDNLNSH